MQNSKALHLDLPQSRLYSPWETSNGLSLFCLFSSDTPIRIVPSFSVAHERTSGQHECEHSRTSLRSNSEMPHSRMMPGQRRRKRCLADGSELRQLNVI